MRFGSGENLRPFPFPTGTIIALQAQERAGEFDYTKHKRITFRPRKGERVQIKAGTWQGFIGEVLAAPSSKRAKVRIEGPYGRTETLDIAHLAAA